MITHSLIQGTPEWKAHRASHFNASDAPAMMGVSQYKTRSDLVREYATGACEEIDAATQKRFDDGHRYEALARPLAEAIIGEDLYPVVGSEGLYSASFDGLTLAEHIGFEHKSLNNDLRALMVEGCTGADLHMQYQVQMEQQCMVSGASRILFMASKWNGDELVEERHCWYEANESLRAEIVAGWAQFEQDVAAYEHVEVLPAPVAAPVKDLPALSIRVDGALTLHHNLVPFGDRLKSFIAEIDMNPSDDQAFADAEYAIKSMERAEAALGAAEASALGQISSVDEMVKTVASYKDLARKTRLMLEKVVKARKETIRVEIQQEAKDKAAAHIATLNSRLGKPYMPHVEADFAGVMKGKKTVASLRDACDTELARFKIEANAVADKIQINLGVLRELATNHAFLFADAGQIVLKAADDFAALVKLRISEHEQAEAKKAEELRAKIAAEERAKAEAAAAETVRAAEQAERERVAAETKRQLDEKAAAISKAAQPTITPEAAWPFPTGREARPTQLEVVRATPTTAPTLRLGQINERISPLSISADGLRTLGFEPAGRDKAAVLYHESDFPSMCAAMIRHISAAQSKLAA